MTMTNSGFSDFDGTPLTDKEVSEKFIRCDFIRILGDEKGVSAFAQWQRVRDEQGVREASDFYFLHCHPDVDWDGSILENAPQDQCDQIFEMLVQEIRSMTPEELKRLKAEAEELRRRDALWAQRSDRARLI
jgi:hypothetical protein